MSQRATEPVLGVVSSRTAPATIIDVAREAGLSKSTASRALTGSGHVSADARRRAEDAARRLGYTPNGLARSMLRGKSELIGALVPDAATPFFARAVRGIADIARASGFEVVLTNTDGDLEAERRALKLLTERRSDGIIVAPASVTDGEHISVAVGAGIPVVQLDRRVQGVSRAGSVTIDNIQGGYIAVRHLTELGHRKIALVTEAAGELERWARRRVWGAGIMPSAARLGGYVRALADAGLELDRDLVVRSEYRREAAMVAVEKLLARRQDITAIFCTDGVLTSGAFEALQRSGLSCPGRVSLIGFDDQEWSTMVRPELTIVQQPDYELGRAAGRQLLERIADATLRPRDVRFSARLVVRGSTAPPPGMSL